MKIEKFRELYIKVDREDSDAFAAAVDAALSDGWVHAHKAEEDARRHDVPEAEWFYYVRDDREGREPVLLAIYRRDAETLYVSNVVPLARFRLTHEQYNGAVQEFSDKVLSRVKAKFSFAFMLSSDQVGLDLLMSPEAFEQLKQFSRTANKSTGSSHPSDRREWFAFLVTLHRTGHKVDADALVRWLTEEEKWPGEVAGKLGVEFEFGMGLLKQNSEIRNPKSEGSPNAE